MSDDESMSDEEYQQYWQHMDELRCSDPRRYHEELCEKGDGWSHAFDVGSMMVDPNDDTSYQIENIRARGREVLDFFTAENWRKMREEISQSTVLKLIDLSHSYSYGNSDYEFSAEDITALFVALFGEEQTHNFPLEELNLSNNQIGRAGMAGLLPFLKSRSSLRSLNLVNTNLDNDGARLLSEALNYVRIDHLCLHDNSIGDEGVECLLSAQNSIHLVRLSIGNNEFGRRGYDAISRFLGRDGGIPLEALFVNCLDGECSNMLINSIPSNSKLEVLSAYDEVTDDDLALLIAPAVLNLVCDKSSFDSLCRSNHRLQSLGILTMRMLDLYFPTLKNAFDINARTKYGASNTKRLRSKLRAFYFQGEFDVYPFIRMNVKLMPYVLELLTKTEVCIGKEKGRLGSGTYYEVCGDNLNGMYRLIRNCHLPELFSFTSLESKLRQQEVKIEQLEADNAFLKDKVDQLTMENKELRILA